MESFEILATRLKELRNSMFMTQKEFSEEIGFTQATLSAYENNQKKPSLDIVRDIAKKCGVSIDWLCGLSDNKNSDNEFKTYSDVIRLLLKISTDANIGITVDSDEFSGIMYFHNYGIRRFIEEWEKMKELYDKNMIDHEVYGLWIEKTLSKYNYPLGSMEESF
jgi:transcriptional regulator with XRE-family HTH domain|uniref:Helix-turn-helix domain protein n=1 Tax=Myoviridae sp. ct2cn10 TaxID=2825022 RepID=A0A8S5PBE9_9CAUD|nr:helix-turn-helix transcriptional regulator [uncultured Lachnoclostridium sp.]DAE03933.1 MAG TPA: helix-turn-helix domain protein [Myoviridae sp. ct2cn10]